MHQEDTPNFCRITYHSGTCGIIYRAANTKHLANGKYEEIYDNFSLISAAHLFKNLKTIPTHHSTETKPEIELTPEKGNYVDLRITNLITYTPQTTEKQNDNVKSIDPVISSSNDRLILLIPGMFICMIIIVKLYQYFHAKD